MVSELIGHHAQGQVVTRQDHQLDVHVPQLVGHGHAVAGHVGEELRVHHIGGHAGVGRPGHGIVLPPGADHRHQLEIRDLFEIHGVQDRLEPTPVAGGQDRRANHAHPP